MYHAVNPGRNLIPIGDSSGAPRARGLRVIDDIICIIIIIMMQMRLRRHKLAMGTVVHGVHCATLRPDGVGTFPREL